MKRTFQISRGFSLVELLVVVAILGLMAGAGAVALGGGAKSLQGSAAAASTIFGLARTEAILRNSDVLVLVDTSFNPAKPDNYLRRMAVYSEATNGAGQIAKWTTLPGNAYFNEALSLASGTTNIPNLPGSTGMGTYTFYKFKPNGQSDGRAQFVISAGSVRNGSFLEQGTNSRYGFVIHKMGKQTFFADASSIPKL